MPRPFGPNPTAAAERTRRWRAKRKESLMIDQTDEQQRKTEWARRMAEVQAGGPENSDTGVVSQQPAAQALKPNGAAEAVAPLPLGGLGSMGDKLAAAIAGFVLVDMFASYCTGREDLKGAIKFAERQFQRIYR
jgi:hypothetical protein